MTKDQARVKSKNHLSNPKSRRKVIGGLPPVFIDVLFIVILFFVVITNITSKSYSEAPQELNLPAVNLSKIVEQSSSSLGITQNFLLVLTLSISELGKIQYHINKENLSFPELSDHLRKEEPLEVCLRVDESIPHGRVMEVISLCQQRNIQRVSFAVEPKKLTNEGKEK